MTPTIRLLPLAARDLDEQADYPAGAAGLETALRFYDSAASTFEAIGRMPRIGQPWNPRRPRMAGLRAQPIEGFPYHVAFYRPVEGGVEIVRVLHGSRDVDVALGTGAD